MDVDPERDFAEAARVGRIVLDRAARGPRLLEREGAVAPRRLPPVAAKGRDGRGVAGAVRAEFGERVEVDVLLAGFDEALLARLRVLGREVEAGFADEEGGDRRGVAEVVGPDGARLGGAPAEELRAMVPATAGGRRPRRRA
ncbi:MAG: hypothetical protein IKH04_11080 [Kiritimatiellae bacterium]|nr:hypothetical protein [Kiritimatiellia bacterium]